MSDLNAIKARLGSIPEPKMDAIWGISPAAALLLRFDLPTLIIEVHSLRLQVKDLQPK